MWSQFIIAVLTMVVGLILGAAGMDAYKTSHRMDKIERELQKLKRRMEAGE